MSAIIPIQSVKVADTHVQVIEYKNEPVLTFAMIDAIHQRVEGTAKRAVSENKERFNDLERFLVPSSEKHILRTFGIDVPNRGLTLITQRGYLKHVKILNDERAWDVMSDMIDVYFKVKQEKPVDLSDPATLLQLVQVHAEQNLKNQQFIQEQECKIVNLEPKAQGYDNFLYCDGLCNLSNAMRQINAKPNKALDWLRTNGHFFEMGTNRNTPSLYLRQQQYFEVKAVKSNRDGKTYPQTFASSRGIAWLAKVVPDDLRLQSA